MGSSSTHSETWFYKVVGGQRHDSAALSRGKRPSVDGTGYWVGLGAGLDGNNA